MCYESLDTVNSGNSKLGFNKFSIITNKYLCPKVTHFYRN